MGSGASKKKKTREETYRPGNDAGEYNHGKKKKSKKNKPDNTDGKQNDKSTKKGKKKTKKGKSIETIHNVGQPGNEYQQDISNPPPKVVSRIHIGNPSYGRESITSEETEYVIPWESQMIGNIEDEQEYCDIDTIKPASSILSIPNEEAPKPKPAIAVKPRPNEHPPQIPEAKPRSSNPIQSNPPPPLPQSTRTRTRGEGPPPVPGPRVTDKSTAKTDEDDGSESDTSYENSESDEETPGIQVVVAIDFGTTFSGYAYSHVNTKDDIKMNPNWTGGSAASFKTPTTVVMNEQGELQSFGFDAENMYFDEENKEIALQYYKEFKLHLMKKDLSEHTLIEGIYGKAINAIQLFSEVLKYLRKHIIRQFGDQGYNYKVTHIRWVLTVPAIWEDNQKLFMRRAALEAGLILELESDNLLIALEPEAASLYCRSLKMNCFKDCAGTKLVSLSEGSIYIVVDAGGGTIDITIHKLIEDGKTAEIDHAKGGPWGGSKVNGRFSLKMQAILGEDFAEHCNKENPVAWLELIREFEIAKQSEAAKPNSEKKLVVKLGYGLSNCYQQFKNESIKEAFARDSNSGITMSDRTGNIELSRDNVRDIFKTVVFKTTDLLSYLLQKPKIAPADTIFIVGGFGQCPYLQEEIKEKISGTNRRVLIPAEGNLCVLRGAVMFGHQSDFISKRVAQYTYAYLHTRKYDPTVDKERTPFQLSDGEKVVRYLEPIIQKDDHVTADEEIVKEFDVETEEFILEIFSSDQREVDDPDSTHVTKQGTLKISLPRSRRHSKLGKSETVRVTFKLGTELKVRGTHLASNTTTQTTLRLLA